MTLRTSTLFLLMLASLAFLGCHGSDEPATSLDDTTKQLPGIIPLDAAEQERLGIVLAPVRSETVTVTLSAVGWLAAPPATETIIRAPVAGYVMNDPKHQWPTLGQEISSGDTVAQVKVFLSPQEVSQLVQAKEDNDIQMQQALVTMKLSESQLKQVAAARDAVTGVRVDQLKEAFERSKAAYEEAQDKVPFLIQEPYDNGVLIKPVSVEIPAQGRILRVHCVAGQFVQSGDPLWTVADWSTLWLRVPVFDSDAHKLDPLRPAQVRDRETENSTTATPVTVPTEIKQGTRTVDFFYKLDNPDWKLRVGQSMAVELATAEAQRALMIPHSAVLYDGFGQAFCYAAEADRTQFRRKRIELGSRHQDLVVVLRGLTANEFVVAVGGEQLAAEEGKADLSVEDDDE